MTNRYSNNTIKPKAFFIIAVMTLFVIIAVVLQHVTIQSYAYDGGKDNCEYYLIKVDENGDPVPGATFSVDSRLVWNDMSVDTTPAQWVTTSSDEATEFLTHAPDRTKVILKEIVTPEGYEPADDVVLEMWLNGRTGDWEGTVNGVSVEPCSRDPIVIINKLKNYDIKIAKKEEGIGGKYLAGAVLEITGTTVKGKTIDKITITSTEGLFTASLPAGSYKLHEVTPPEGYELVDDIDFDVGMDGSVTVDGNKVDEVVMADPKKHEPKPLLSVKKTSNVKSAKPGDVIPFVITVTNKGDGDADEVLVLDTMGDTLSYVSDDSGGTTDGQKISWNIKLAAGETKTINISCRINESASGKVINNVEITNVESEYIEPSGGDDSFVLGVYEEESSEEKEIEEDDGDNGANGDDEVKTKGVATGDSSTSDLIAMFILSALALAAMAKARTKA